MDAVSNQILEHVKENYCRKSLISYQYNYVMYAILTVGISVGNALGARLGTPDGLAEGFLLGLEEGLGLELGLVAVPRMPMSGSILFSLTLLLLREASNVPTMPAITPIIETNTTKM